MGKSEMQVLRSAQDDKQLSTQPTLSLTAARHPLLELRMIAEARAAGTEPKQPIPLTVALTDDARQLIISGPNTGGKTVSLKTIGLVALMAQAGVPVPAEEANAAHSSPASSPTSATRSRSSATSPASPRTSSTSTASRAKQHLHRSCCSMN